MLNLLQPVILGVIEGITEYLPVSSTFHLIWTSRFLGIINSEFQKAFEVIIQSGAIFAIVILYWKVIITNTNLVKKVLVAFIPTAIVGLLLYKIIKGFFFENYLLQVIIFIVVGLSFIIFEKYKKGKLNLSLDTLTYQQAIFIGLIQSLAVVPGVSRAGAVILGLMYLGIKREDAAVFSFLLAVPTLLAATVLDLVKTWPILLNPNNSIQLLIGFFVSFLSALIFVRWFVSFLQKHSLASFGWYRIILGVILLIWLING